MGKIKKIGIIAVVIVVLISFWSGSWYRGSKDEDQYITEETQEAAVTEIEIVSENKTIGVHVVGAVANPGLYYFSEGARVDDAIKAAIALDSASLESLNLAAYITDGMQIKVPDENEVQTVYETVNGTSVSSFESSHYDTEGKLNINTATKEELMTLPGIGDVYSGRIIEYRQSNGGFKSIDELTNIKGISTKTLAKFSDAIYVG